MTKAFTIRLRLSCEIYFLIRLIDPIARMSTNVINVLFFLHNPNELSSRAITRVLSEKHTTVKIVRLAL